VFVTDTSLTLSPSPKCPDKKRSVVVWSVLAQPDQNALRGEAILRQGGWGGILTDPRTGHCHESSGGFSTYQNLATAPTFSAD
jgi:hypothetical protein